MNRYSVAVRVLLITLLLYVVVDVLFCRLILHWGFSLNTREYREQRYDTPFVEFLGKPGALDHNEMGYRGPSIRQAPDSAYRILFFGGSTGYYGEPPLPVRLQQNLSRAWGREVFVANCSVVSSNHRQHLHAIVEQFLDQPVDLVVFYGGYNENIHCLYYDPRPNYPFNYFYRHECPRWRLLLIQYSAILGEAEKRFGIVSGIRSQKHYHGPEKEKWITSIVDGYFHTLDDARRLSTGLLHNAKGDSTRFLSFYQPYRVDPTFSEGHSAIVSRSAETPGMTDLSACLDELAKRDPSIYYDNVHVNPEADSLIAQRLAESIVRQIPHP